MSSMVSPARLSARSVDGIGPTPMSAGSTPANAYPTMRIFRQRKSGDWEEAVARVAEELERVSR